MAKGARFERVTCHLLSRWILPNSKEIVFWRSALSGGVSTVAAKRGNKLTSHAGDIVCTHPAGAWFTEAFCLELKHYRNLNLAQSLLYGYGKLTRFWNKHCTLAERVDKLPILIAKQNQVDTIVLFTPDAREKLVSLGYPAPSVLRSYTINEEQPTIVCLFKDVFVTKGKSTK